MQALALELYMGSYSGSGYSLTGHDGKWLEVRSRKDLQLYDPEITSLLDAVFPCRNNFKYRCRTEDERSRKETGQAVDYARYLVRRYYTHFAIF